MTPALPVASERRHSESDPIMLAIPVESPICAERTGFGVFFLVVPFHIEITAGMTGFDNVGYQFTI